MLLTKKNNLIIDFMRTFFYFNNPDIQRTCFLARCSNGFACLVILFKTSNDTSPIVNSPRVLLLRAQACILPGSFPSLFLWTSHFFSLRDLRTRACATVSSWGPVPLSFSGPRTFSSSSPPHSIMRNCFPRDLPLSFPVPLIFFSSVRTPDISQILSFPCWQRQVIDLVL